MTDRSYGLIVYFLEKEGPCFLLVRHKLGHTSFPKGHPQEGESEKDCALREVAEETGVTQAKLLPQTFQSDYQFNEGDLSVSKQVTFFLARALIKQAPRPKVNEIIHAYWAPYDKALQELTYHNDKRNLELAYKISQRF